MNEDIVSIKDFELSFGDKKIIHGLNFSVKRGEIFGFLGSNGSGKTTTIRALLGIYQADSGELLINGKKFSPERTGLIGYLPEERGLYRKEKVIDVMQYFGQLKGLSKKEARDFSQDFLKRVGLEDKARLNIDKLSGGQQQKIQLGITIMGKPDLLILDEPIMVTHQMEEVEKICNRALLLKNGKTKAYGTVDEIRNQFGKQRIILEFVGALPESDKFEIIKKETNYAELSPKVDSQEILKELISKDLRILNFKVQKSTLNEIFLEIYGKEGEEKNV